MYIFLSQHNDRLIYMKYIHVLNMKGLKGGGGMQTDTENRKLEIVTVKRHRSDHIWCTYRTWVIQRSEGALRGGALEQT